MPSTARNSQFVFCGADLRPAVSPSLQLPAGAEPLWRLAILATRIAAPSPPAEAHCSGAERRQSVAHGVSRGFSGASRKSPGGAKENLTQGALSCSSVAPNGAYVLFERCPTAHAVGYGLSPLRGFAKCRLSPGVRTPENGQSPMSGRRPAPQKAFTASVFRFADAKPPRTHQNKVQQAPD